MLGPLLLVVILIQKDSVGEEERMFWRVGQRGWKWLRWNEVRWACVQFVPPVPSLECGGGSGCEERLDVVWERQIWKVLAEVQRSVAV